MTTTKSKATTKTIAFAGEAFAHEVKRGDLILLPDGTGIVTVTNNQPTDDRGLVRRITYRTMGGISPEFTINRWERIARQIEVRVGLGATIPYVTDTSPAVVTRVTAKTIKIRMVTDGEIIDRQDDGLGIVTSAGNLDEPYGDEIIYTAKEVPGKGIVYYRAGYRLILGRATRRVNYNV